MIQVEKLTYGFPEKDLYNDISFSIEQGQHCALIGSNGCGKSTLVEMLTDPEKYWFDGKITKDEECRTGYAGQFCVREKTQDCTVFEYLSRRFTDLQDEIAKVCEEMAHPENDEADMERLFSQYQALLDQNEAMDGDNYENAIRRQLNAAGMGALENTKLSDISGGEYKLLQIMKEMLLAPNFLVLDEPDVFLDFENLNGLCRLINGFKGTILAVTHNRYLLNHCFDKILHLENGDLQEFDGTYSEYRCWLLREKIELKLQHIEEQEEIARTEEMVEILRKRATLMVNPTIGQAVNAKQSQLDRLLARQIKAPFIEVRQPRIAFPQVETGGEPENGENGKPGGTPKGERTEKRTVLELTDYELKFDEHLLRDVSFEVKEGEKVALIGANGTGKSTLIREIVRNENPAIQIADGMKYACFSQLGEDAGLQIANRAVGTRTEEEGTDRLSGGERNLKQLEALEHTGAELLLLDEPSAHLDLYAQAALEKALKEYKGTVFMVTHDFYLAADCADYVLLIDDNTVRRIRSRNFRKMVYDKYFDSSYLEADRKKQELEQSVEAALRKNDLGLADKFCEELEKYSIIR